MQNQPGALRWVAEEERKLQPTGRITVVTDLDPDVIDQYVRAHPKDPLVHTFHDAARHVAECKARLREAIGAFKRAQNCIYLRADT